MCVVADPREQFAMRVLIAALACVAAVAAAAAPAFPLTELGSFYMLGEVVEELTKTVRTISIVHDGTKHAVRVRELLRKQGEGYNTIVDLKTSATTAKQFQWAGLWNTPCVSGPQNASTNVFLAHVVTAHIVESDAAKALLRYDNTTTWLGIDADVFIADGLSLALAGETCVLRVRWYFAAAGWSYQSRAEPGTLIGVLVEGQCSRNIETEAPASATGTAAPEAVAFIPKATPPPWTVSLRVHVDRFYRYAEDDAVLHKMFLPLGSCNTVAKAPTVPGETEAPAAFVTATPMPELPEDFSAYFTTTMMERRATFTVYEAFSSALQMARTTTRDNALAGKISSVIVNGIYQLAYHAVSVALPDASASMYHDGTWDSRKLFTAKDTTCSKSVFNFELVGTVRELLLMSIANGPRYMGHLPVRGIKAQFWEAATENLKITWFFAAEDWTFQGNVAPVGLNRTRPLLRMVIVGKGKSPLFTFHPFLQKDSEVGDAHKAACSAFFGGPATTQCAAGEEYFHHIYDVTSFVPAVDTKEFELPPACVKEHAVEVKAYPAATNCPKVLTGWEVFGMCFIAGVFGAIMAASIVYFRMRQVYKSNSAAE
jgi:hypothetical protein